MKSHKVEMKNVAQYVSKKNFFIDFFHIITSQSEKIPNILKVHPIG